MAHIVILGAGLGGAVMAYEMKAEMRAEDRLTVITKDPKISFRSVQPVGGRELARAHRQPRSTWRQPCGGAASSSARSPPSRWSPPRTALTWSTAHRVDYDYLIIATGPELAFDEIEGLGPDAGYTQSVCHIDHAEKAHVAFEEFCKDPRPDRGSGAVQGASCFGPAYEFLFILETELEAPQDPRQGADDLRHFRALYRVILGHRRRRRYQGPARIQHARQAHQVDDLVPRSSRPSRASLHVETIAR